MRLVKARYITLLNYAVNDDVRGYQGYTLINQVQMLASVMRYKASMSPDFQVDLARIKDHLMLYSNQEIKTDQSVIVRVNGLYYLPIYNEDTKFLDPRDGYFKTIVKLNVDEGYGVRNGNNGI